MIEFIKCYTYENRYTFIDFHHHAITLAQPFAIVRKKKKIKEYNMNVIGMRYRYVRTIRLTDEVKAVLVTHKILTS